MQEPDHEGSQQGHHNSKGGDQNGHLPAIVSQAMRPTGGRCRAGPRSDADALGEQLAVVGRVAEEDLGALGPLSARTGHYNQREGVRQPASVDTGRLRPGSGTWPRCCSSSVTPISEFVRFADNLRRVVGGRHTYVSTSSPEGQPGPWYFVADLQPFALPFEPTSMAFDRAHLSQNLRALADRRRPLGAVVTRNPESEDSRIAIKRLGPNLEVRRLPYGDSVVQVFLASR